ncbi:MAG: substrate-binding domain-containing protein [Eubacterium sp.]|nr:substrate-binding domain-containing protein [Eubacterium sp.]
MIKFKTDKKTKNELKPELSDSFSLLNSSNESLGKNSNKSFIGLLLLGIGLLVVISLVFSGLYRKVIDNVGDSVNESEKEYKRHYVLIVDGLDSVFWDDVYSYMQEEASLRNDYVELVQWNVDGEYDVCKLIDKAIISDVDGIILQYSNDEKVDEKINEAAGKGIPVVTLMNDSQSTERIAYVGVNAYSIAQDYADELSKMMDGETEKLDVAFFITDSETNSNQYQIFSQTRNIIGQNYKLKSRVEVTALDITEDNKFSVNGIIRNYFNDPDNRPDYVICFDLVITESLYQTLVDYNLLGRTKIIGYYKSDNIMNSLINGNVASTLVLDAEGMGVYPIEALDNYIESGHNNIYYTVSYNFLDKEDAIKSYEDDVSEKDSDEEIDETDMSLDDEEGSENE